MALFTCDCASFAYEGHIVARNISFWVEGGDFLCIVGENGSGKSTLVSGLMGLIPPVSGRLSLGEGLKPYEIGYMPQKTQAQSDFPATVLEIALSGRLGSKGLFPFYTRQDRLIAKDALMKLGMLDLRNRCFRELSGGQQQRALLARALCSAKRALVLDEPAAGLDPAASQSLYEVMWAINNTGVAVVMVTHDLHEALNLATKVLHLKNGGQLFFGPLKDYLLTEEGSAYVKGAAQ